MRSLPAHSHAVRTFSRDCNVRIRAQLRSRPIGMDSTAPRRHLTVCPLATAMEVVSPDDFLKHLNHTCNNLVKVMREKDDDQAWEVFQQLDDIRIGLADTSEHETVCFLCVLQSLLNHQVHKDATQLKGVYKRAFDSLCTNAQEYGWNLNNGGSRGAATENPTTSSPSEESVGSEQKQGQGSQEKQKQHHGVTHSTAVREHYVTLGVLPDAPAASIKAAFRSLALKWHPDVNSDPQAHDRFLEISAAYDVLSDEQSRRLYDLHGAQGLAQRSGGAAGRGNSSRFWDEFKPHKRQNKSTRARDASRQASPCDSGAASRQAVVGDVVEYPLSAVVQRQLRDGRQRGVALLVGRNMDRADASRLPAELLDLCELEPLRQQDRDSQQWVSDELLPPAFCHLSELLVVPVVRFDHRHDTWLIHANLSPGCAGPELGEEIMV